MNAEIGDVLVALREAAGLTQKQVAFRLSSNQTRMSRIESGEASLADTLGYLEALGTERAKSFKTVLTKEWRHLPRPSMRHPDIATLVELEDGLCRLAEMMQRTQSLRLQRHLTGWRESLLADGAYLSSLEHRICYAGPASVGKSTIVSQQMSLFTSQVAGRDSVSILPIGGGRTNVCSVIIHWSDRYTLEVEPYPLEQINGFVSDLCQVAWSAAAGHSKATTVHRPPRIEIERAIRNMAGLARVPRTIGKDGQAIPPSDPLLQLALRSQSVELLTEAFIHRMRLWRRVRTRVSIDGYDQQTCQATVRQMLLAINAGLHSDFQLPMRIRLTVPRVNGIAYRLVAIDTRALDEQCPRRDLRGYMADERTIVVLCSNWASAPEPSLIALLKSANASRYDPSLAIRTSWLVAAHPGQPLSMRDEAGATVESTASGYALKQTEVEEALETVGALPVEPICYNAVEDTRHTLMQHLSAKVKSVRNYRLRLARLRLAAVDAVADGSEDFETLLDTLVPVLALGPDQLKLDIDKLKTDLQAAFADVSADALREMVYRRNSDAEVCAIDCALSAIARPFREIIESVLANACNVLDSRRGKARPNPIFTEVLRAGLERQASLFLDAVHQHARTIFTKTISENSTFWAICERAANTPGIDHSDALAGSICSVLDNHECIEKFENRTLVSWTLLISGFVEENDEMTTSLAA